MSVSIEFIFLIIAIGLCVPTGVLAIECIGALWGERSIPEIPTEVRSRVAAIVPAHNEEGTIEATIQSLSAQLGNCGRAIVIADNCTDDTAAVARRLGVTVLERKDDENKGKGYALDYGVQFLAQDPPDVVVVMDADCLCGEGAIARISSLAAHRGRPVQALYLMEQPPQPQGKDSVSALAFLVKNWVRPRGLARLGLPCLLTGTGMAFPWSVLRSVSLASGNIVEDMQMGLDLAIAGYPPLFCETAIVTGILPRQSQVAKGQRMRWEHGHLRTLLTQVPRLFKEAIKQRRFELFAIALDLCIPPLSLLVLVWGIAFLGAVVFAYFGIARSAASILTLEGVLMVLAILGAWAKFGREVISGRSLLAIPLYILWKIPLYFAFWLKPQTQWVKTKREI
ncbi:glycosyltransferase family 2 protein [Lusitaniella coriacea]|uniref:glycosyltransferase family 2 protein n=1 Tax=Lusitaniella coriacea TaxID=1983105 RepID=UPI002D21BC77|nr:glycosyltransferase family 2 protein [Lusitaniella coriacea]